MDQAYDEICNKKRSDIETITVKKPIHCSLVSPPSVLCYSKWEQRENHSISVSDAIRAYVDGGLDVVFTNEKTQDETLLDEYNSKFQEKRKQLRELVKQYNSRTRSNHQRRRGNQNDLENYLLQQGFIPKNDDDDDVDPSTITPLDDSIEEEDDNDPLEEGDYEHEQNQREEEAMNIVSSVIEKYKNEGVPEEDVQIIKVVLPGSTLHDNE